MYPISSTIENRQDRYMAIHEALKQQGFSLGGNWDYAHGCFDRALEEGQKVWLRIPFQVVSGTFDGLQDDPDAQIQLGTPYVLKHVYQEGLDGEARIRTYGAMLDQFQAPVDADAEVEKKWIDSAEKLLARIEQAFV
ncbi:YugN family protein [Marinicrinis sediminis]|uniref:YugN family protein n=1 Tax=Marinicrinis sediminis TaxID=1652465 RepID=A0ABW5R8M9_9BACL